MRTASPTARIIQTEASPLVSYALRGLRRCWLPNLGRYSHRFRLVDGTNESIPESDCFYTLNVLLGSSRVPDFGPYEEVNILDTYLRCCEGLRSPRTRTYAYGMALWAGAELGIEPPAWLQDHVNRIRTNPRLLRGATAQDIGMLISGSVALASRDGNGRWQSLAQLLIDRLCRHYRHPTTYLFYNQATGYRRMFSSFASQVYSILALYQFGAAFGADWAISLANQSAKRVIALQGPRGEWGWFYYVPGARVVDFYEIYSVHQHGMAPAFLHHAVEHRVPSAREALVKGFSWLFADNEMRISMLRPNEQMFYRSQSRAGELTSTWRRACRSAVNAFRGQPDTVSNHRGLVLRQECRSYELGWILWSFGSRTDYPELTNRAEFG